MEFDTLREMLEIPQTRLQDILYSGIPLYLDKREIMREYKDLSPTDRMVIFYIEKLVNVGADKIMIESVLEIYENRQEKSRMKKKLDQLLNYTDNEDRMIENKGAMKFLRDIRLDF